MVLVDFITSKQGSNIVRNSIDQEWESRNVTIISGYEKAVVGWNDDEYSNIIKHTIPRAPTEPWQITPDKLGSDKLNIFWEIPPTTVAIRRGGQSSCSLE